MNIKAPDRFGKTMPYPILGLSADPNEQKFNDRRVPPPWRQPAVSLFYFYRHPLFFKLTMNTASKLGLHTQTNRGTCPGVGL